ncbi:hypothetical protein [Proteiniborus sp. MB09-C3]|uniref:hypothetical protein n=1 Tax=Proteiniborus sp. MB09-C3 TaxID=3050072 RepID=UPI00255337D7|nr:hypothetical protein [Proteiniborus sp. MB09-C3]WIV11127.1 hypothetical protein QO263_13340 [Proteiniborus sp. MB09-C3]
MKLGKISLLLSIVLLLNVLLPSFVLAAGEIDYKDYILELKRTYGLEFDTPLANFDIYVNGSYLASTNITKQTPQEERLSLLPRKEEVRVKVGDKITIRDRSSLGKGNSIKLYDLQVAQGIVGDTSSRFNTYSNINQVITAEMPGEMVIFLNVADNYSGVPNFDNFSQYGNWRTEVIKPSGDPNVQIKGWYFTAIKIIVEDSARPKADFKIYHQGRDVTDNYSNPIEVEKYPVTVNIKDESITEKGDIVAWEYGVKISSNNWGFVSNEQHPTTTASESIVVYRLRVQNSLGQWSPWQEHAILVKLKEDGSGPPVGGNINAVLDGPDMVEWGSTIRLDSSRSTSTSTITKREYWRKTSRQNDWVLQLDWENMINPSERTIEDGNASYIDFKLKITDRDGRTSEDIHRVTMVERVEPEVFPNLRFIGTESKPPFKISLEDYLENKEMTVNYHVSASHSTSIGTGLGHFYFFQNIDDSEIKKYEEDPREALNDPNLIERVVISTNRDPDEIYDAGAYGAFTFKPQNPVIKASLLLRASLIGTPVKFATAYHTVELDIDSIPPTTQISIPSIFYPKEINNLEHKTITWSYFSEQNIPYRHSIVSLYKKTQDGYYEEVFKNRIMNERKLVVEGDAHEEYEIFVKVVDELGKESERVEGEFTIIGAVPVIDLELDNKTNPNVLKIQVFNKTPEEIESLFPTSYTTWKIEDEDKNIIVEGDGEAPNTVDLDYRFNRGKYTVTQYATNTLGVTAYASKDFEITSILDFKAEPYVQFEDDFIKLIDLSKYITDKRWEIRENSETEFSNLYLNSDNQFTRNEGIYQIKLLGMGYFEYVGETERETTKTVAFLSTKPNAAFILSGNLKMYKQIILDGSISKQVTEERLQEKYPIDFTHEKTVFEIIPIKAKDGETDTSRLEYILGNDKEVLEDRVIFKGKQLLSIRIDKEGWYKARYKVYNHRKESDWYEEEFYVSPKLSPRADISVGAPVVFRAPDNELKVKMEVIVDYESLDEEIDFDKSTLFLSYSPNREGQLEQTLNMHIKKNTRNLKELTSNFSDIIIDWREKRAVFTLILDDPKKNFFGRFIFDFLAIEKEKIPNYTELGDIPDNLSKADTSHVNTELKTILIDNNKPYIELQTTKTNTVDIYILEEREKEKELDVDSIIKMLNLNRIKTRVIIIRPEGVEVIE